MPLHLILDHLLGQNVYFRTQKVILQEVKQMVFQASVFKRELALENFRKYFAQSLPSRLDCLYVTTEQSVNYWRNQLLDGDLDVFRIATMDEPFKTKEKFIPNESLNYEEMYNSSLKYWKPKLKNASEYLIQGKVKILEKVEEIKKK